LRNEKRKVAEEVDHKKERRWTVEDGKRWVGEEKI
jgi:hypothetical protein